MTSILIDRRDGLSSATAVKGPCLAATTANITLAGLQTIDGVVLVSFDRVLVKDQTNATENGIYHVNTGDWYRAKDFSRNDDVVDGTRVAVTDGVTNAATAFQVSITGEMEFGVTLITFINVDANRTFSTLTVTGPVLARGGSIELGRVDGAASTPFIDFHSGSTPTDRDARIIVSGGDGANNGGDMNIQAETLKFNSSTIKTVDWDVPQSIRRWLTKAQWGDVLAGDATDPLSVELQNAEDEVSGAGGGIIEYPAGVFPIDGYKGFNASFNINYKGGLYVRGGVHHRGVPGKTIWRNMTDHWRCLVSIREGTDFSFDGIVFDGNRYNFTNATVLGDGEAIRGEAIIFWNGLSPTKNIIIRNCGFKNTAHYGCGVQNVSVENFLFDGNWCDDVGGDFIDIKKYEIVENYPKIGMRISNNVAKKIGSNWQERVADNDGPQTAYDIRGECVVVNNFALDIDTYNSTQVGNDGFRVNADISSTGRIGGKHSVLANNYARSAKLDSEGSVSTKQTRGLVIYTEDVSVTNFYAENFYIGGTIFLGGGGTGSARRATITNAHFKNCKGSSGDGVGLNLSSAGGTSGDHFIEAVISDSDLGLQCTTGGCKGVITLKGNTKGHNLGASTLAANAFEFTFLGNTADADVDDAINNDLNSRTIWGASGATAPKQILRSTKDGAWSVGEVLGEYDIYSSDLSGLGVGTKVSLRALSTGTSGSSVSAALYGSGASQLAKFFEGNDLFLWLANTVLPRYANDGVAEGAALPQGRLYVAPDGRVMYKLPTGEASTVVGGAALGLNTFDTRAILAGVVLAFGTTLVTVRKYATSGPVVNMVYSINGTDQTSTDPTCMTVTITNSSGANVTQYTKLVSTRVTPGMMGAPYDGSTDDAPFIQRALTYFGNCYPDAKLDLTIKTPVKMPSASVLDFTGGGKWLVDTAGSFTNTVYTNRYTDASAIIQVHGSTSGTDIPKDGVIIRGVRMTPAVQTDHRHLVNISLINTTNCVVENNEIYAFCVGDAICLNSCSGGQNTIRENYIHDFSSSFNWALADCQITGIDWDPDRVHGGKSSTRLVVSQNRIMNFTKTGAALTFGIQTDGIHSSGPSTAGYNQIQNNWIEGVDEGIDCFSSWNTIQGNHIISPTGSGIKLISGACDNLVTGNHIINTTLWGFSVVASVSGPCSRNRFYANKVYAVGGSLIATPYFIYMHESGGNTVSDNLFEANTFDSNGTLTYNVACDTTLVNRSVGDHWITNGTTGFLTTSTSPTNFIIERPVNSTLIKMRLPSDFTKDGTGTSEKLPFTTVIYDSRSEYVASSINAPVVIMPGYYKITMVLTSATWPVSNRCIFHVLSNNVSLTSSADIALNRYMTHDSDGTVTIVLDDVFLSQSAGTVITVLIGFNTGTSMVVLSDPLYTSLTIEKK